VLILHSDRVHDHRTGLVKKGRLLYVEGRLHWSSWQAPDGSPRRSREVRVSSLQVLDQRPEHTEVERAALSGQPQVTARRPVAEVPFVGKPVPAQSG
jgi:single-stranded DNA-binding protein